MRKLLSTIAITALSSVMFAQSWPTPTLESKPGTRWWWLGSAVDKSNLEWNLKELSAHGIGAVEITPIYGVQGNEKNNIDFLSNQWMEMLRFTQDQGKRKGIEVDMATGTGWPFGGPFVPLKESACKVLLLEKTIDSDGVWNTINGYKGVHPESKNTTVVDLSLSEKDKKNAFLDKVILYSNGKTVDVTSNVKDGKIFNPLSLTNSNEVKLIAVFIKYGVMRVKRAAPGGDGLVIDHFNKKAVRNYLKHIEEAFERTNTPYPHTFFNDSYEVAEATWTPLMFEEFAKRRGYKLEDHLPELIAQSTINSKSLDSNKISTIKTIDSSNKVLADYRETLSDLLLENFTQQWTAWAHSHGAITRNQAHGSPANLIDCYAAVDIPEIEGFGLSNFGIKGLREDPGNTRKNDSDFSMLKYAPSAAHVTGKPYTSSETFTWLTEHFRTSLSQLKPDIDLMFCAGVNHMFFHGTCYSPKDVDWPGWKFYASIDMSPTNSIWRDAPYFMQYVERCQSFLQWGQPDNDFLVLLPVRDMWKKNTGKLLMQFSIHEMSKLAPEFIETILDIDRAGFDCDYISERLLLGVSYVNGMLVTSAGTRYKGLIIPNKGKIDERIAKHIESLKTQGAHIFYNTDKNELQKAALPEQIRTQCGMKTIRRKNDNGYHYFIANLTPNDVEESITLSVPFKNAMWFNPLNGEISQASFTNNKVNINLRSGESMILQTFSEMKENISQSFIAYISHTVTETRIIEGPWTLSFIEESPKVNKTYQLPKLQTWEGLDEKTSVTMGTGIYTTRFKMSKKDNPSSLWAIDLGDVRESARVYINGQFIGCAWSVPFVLNTNGTLKVGENELRIEVTNLPANRISQLDRDEVKWRKMEDINVVDINYKKTLYNKWTPTLSGLASEVKLIKLTE